MYQLMERQMLIKIADIADKARAAGFKVNVYNNNGYLEIYAPDHKGETHVNWYGSVYSSADFIVSDSPNTGYGYNGFFYGPFHKGFTQDNAYGVQKLMRHPAMQ
jgi:hypothetical protein